MTCYGSFSNNKNECKICKVKESCARLTARTYLQWNNEDELASLNFRIHFIPKIGSDFYLVYNHLWDGYQDYKTTYNTAIAKIAYMVTF